MMKRALNILVFLSIISGYAQQSFESAYSIYFTRTALDQLKPAAGIPSLYQKKYQLKNLEQNQIRIAAGEFLYADQTGIYLEKNKLLFITRTQVRETGKYKISNGYLHGVIPNDSIPCALEGENYYFLMPSKTYLYENSSNQSVFFQGPAENEFILFTAEPNGHYSAICFRFGINGVDILEPQFDGKTCSCELSKKHEILQGDFNTYILSPSAAEWSGLIKCFQIYDSYEKAN